MSEYPIIEDLTNEDLDLLKFLKCALGRAYISDLRTDQYNERARLILRKIDLRYFSLNSITQSMNYIFKF